MPRKVTPANRLEEAMAMLIQYEASFFDRSESNGHWSALEREISERFARIERYLTTIIRVLAEHSRLLEQLPEAIREKIGFKSQP